MKKNNPFQFISSKGLLLIILLAFMIRLFFFISLQPWKKEVLEETVIVSDAAGYHYLALSLVSKKNFEDFQGFRTPGYPVFVAILYSISSSNISFVLLVQILLNVFSVFLIYKTASIIFDQKIALLSSFLFAIDPLQVVYSVHLLTDTFFVFLFLISIFYLCKGLQTNNYSLYIISALFLGLTTLVRPISLLFPFVAVFFLMLYGLNLKKRLMFALSFGIVFLVTISPWLHFNFSKFGEIGLSSISGYNLLFYNVASTESYKTGKPIGEVRQDYYSLAVQQGCDTTNIKSYKNSRIYSNIAKQYLKDNFFLYCIRHLKGMVYLYCASPSGRIVKNFHIEPKYDGRTKYSGNFSAINLFRQMSLTELIITLGIFLFLLINYLYAAYGVIVSIKDNKMFLFLLISIILYYSVLTGVVGGSRYRLPFMPYINILCAVGLLHFWDITKDRLANMKFKSMN